MVSTDPLQRFCIVGTATMVGDVCYRGVVNTAPFSRDDMGLCVVLLYILRSGVEAWTAAQSYVPPVTVSSRRHFPWPTDRGRAELCVYGSRCDRVSRAAPHLVRSRIQAYVAPRS